MTDSTSDSASSLSGEDELIQDDPLRVTFASSGTGERAGPSDMGATAISEIDTDIKSDAQAQFERVQQILKEEREDKVDEKFDFVTSFQRFKNFDSL